MKKTSKLCKKRKIFKWKIVCFTVTPLAGVWVEIICSGLFHKIPRVTPLAGVWVEILDPASFCAFPAASLPLQECELKFFSP